MLVSRTTLFLDRFPLTGLWPHLVKVHDVSEVVTGETGTFFRHLVACRREQTLRRRRGGSENATIDNCKIQLSMTQKSRKVDFDMTFFLDVTKTFFLVVTFFFLLPSEIKEEALATASTFLPSNQQCTSDAHALPVPPVLWLSRVSNFCGMSPSAPEHSRR